MTKQEGKTDLLTIKIRGNAMDEYKKKELDQLLERVNNCLTKVFELREERDMLTDENHKFAEFLLDDGYTIEDVNNIAKGFNIDIGEKVL